MKYQNKRNLRFANLIEENEKFKTVTMQYEDDGSTTSISSSTLKRWWKKIPESEQVQELTQECPDISEEELMEIEEAHEMFAGDGTPLSEVGKEIAEQAKRKAEEAKRKAEEAKVKKPRKIVGLDIKSYTARVKDICAELGYTVKIYDSEPRMINVKNENRNNICEVYLGNGKVTVRMRGESVPEGVAVARIANCPLSHAVDLTYEDIEMSLGNLLSRITYISKNRKKEDE